MQAVTLKLTVGEETLVCNRYKQDRTVSGKCHPGGKVDDNETPEQAIIREVQEEIGIDISNQSLSTFDTFTTSTRKGDIDVIVYELVLQTKPEITLNTDELESFEWMPYEEWYTWYYEL